MNEPLLRVTDLRMTISPPDADTGREILHGVDLSLAAGEALALVASPAPGSR